MMLVQQHNALFGSATVLLLLLAATTTTTTLVVVEAFIAGATATSKNNHRYDSSSTELYGTRMKYQTPQKVVDQTLYIEVEQPADAWKTMDVVDILQRGGVGVLPTDTGYGFVTALELLGNHNKEGLERILRIKGQVDCKKPVSLLCSNLATIDEYCVGIDKMAFKILKKNLPGPYTFILPAKTTLPKQLIVDSKGQHHTWKRQTLGVRIPDDAILRYLQDELFDGKMPLLVSSLPLPVTMMNDDDNDDFIINEVDDSRHSRNVGQLVNCLADASASWCDQVDFIVDAGPRPYDGSTVFDLTTRDPQLLREGLGDVNLAM